MASQRAFARFVPSFPKNTDQCSTHPPFQDSALGNLVYSPRPSLVPRIHPPSEKPPPLAKIRGKDFLNRIPGEEACTLTEPSAPLSFCFPSPRAPPPPPPFRSCQFSYIKISPPPSLRGGEEGKGRGGSPLGDYPSGRGSPATPGNDG